MNEEKRRRAEAVKTLIRLGWNPPKPTDRIAERIFDDIGRTRPTSTLDLSDSELAALSLMAEGHTYETAAKRMHASRETLKQYLQRAMRKLGANNTTHAVAIAYRHGQLRAKPW